MRADTINRTRIPLDSNEVVHLMLPMIYILFPLWLDPPEKIRTWPVWELTQLKLWLFYYSQWHCKWWQGSAGAGTLKRFSFLIQIGQMPLKKKKDNQGGITGAAGGEKAKRYDGLQKNKQSWGGKQMKVISSDNDREELTENWARRLISLICGIFLLLTSTLCSQISREEVGLAGAPPHLSGRCQVYLEKGGVFTVVTRWESWVDRSKDAKKGFC